MLRPWMIFPSFPFAIFIAVDKYLPILCFVYLLSNSGYCLDTENGHVNVFTKLKYLIHKIHKIVKNKMTVEISQNIKSRQNEKKNLKYNFNK